MMRISAFHDLRHLVLRTGGNNGRSERSAVSESKESQRLHDVLDRRPPHHSVPLSLFFDAQGRRLRLCRLGSRDLGALAQMYAGFERDQASLGIPPVGARRVRDWVEGLCAKDVQLIAKHGEQVAAHAAWVRDGRGGAEVLVFVHPGYQGAGLGRKMLAAVVTMSRFLGVRKLWAEVENRNVPIIRLNQALGFHTSHWYQGTQEMELEPAAEGDALSLDGSGQE